MQQRPDDSARHRPDEAVKRPGHECKNVRSLPAKPARSLLSDGGRHDWKQFASALDDGTLKIWDPITGACSRTLEGHDLPVNSVAFSHDSRQLASASSDSTVKIWDLKMGTCLRTLEGHDNRVALVAFSCDSKLLVSVSVDKTIKIWESATGACI